MTKSTSKSKLKESKVSKKNNSPSKSSKGSTKKNPSDNRNAQALSRKRNNDDTLASHKTKRSLRSTKPSTSHKSRTLPTTEYLHHEAKRQIKEISRIRHRVVKRKGPVLPYHLLPTPEPVTTKTIPSRRTIEELNNNTKDNINTVAIEPFKRITRSMSAKSSLAGENTYPAESKTTKDITEAINLLVSNNKYMIPTTYKQALKTPQKELWIKACEEEHKAMKKLNVYNIVEKGSLVEIVI